MSIVRLGAKAIDTADPILGQVLASTDGVSLGRRNMIINGDMRVAQRATSAASLSAGGIHTVDRFHWYVNAFDELRITMSQDSSVPTGADSGFSKSLKLDCTTAESAIAADENARVWQILEAQDLIRLGYGTSGAKTCTLSFYVKSSLTGTYAVSFWCQDPNRNISKTYTINAANTWEKKTITIPGDTGGTGINNDNGEGMRINWFLNAGSNFTSTNTNNQWDTFASGRHAFGHTAAWGTNTSHDFFLTGVQFEIGGSATEFEHRSLAENQLDCYRYFYKITRTDPYGEFLVIRTYSSTQGTGVMILPAPMRIQPTFTSSSVSGNFSYSMSVLSFSTTDSGTTGSSHRLATHNTVGSFTLGGAAVVQKANNTDPVFMQYDAEF